MTEQELRERLRGRKFGAVVTDADRARAERTVEKLRRITVANGATEAEAANALERIASIERKLRDVSVEFEIDERYDEWLRTNPEIWRMPVPITVNRGWDPATQKYSSSPSTTYFVGGTEFATFEDAIFHLYKTHAFERMRMELFSELDPSEAGPMAAWLAMNEAVNNVETRLRLDNGMKTVGLGEIVEKTVEPIAIDKRLFDGIRFSPTPTGRVVELNVVAPVGKPLNQAKIDEIKAALARGGAPTLWTVELGKVVYGQMGPCRLITIREGR